MFLVNGGRKWMNVNDFKREDVLKWLNMLKFQSGNPDVRLRKKWHTDNPSIQGPWNPFLFRNPELNITSFPSEKFSLPKNIAPSATEILFEMYKKQKLEEGDEEKISKVNPNPCN